ncbi:MAG TPA: SDR family oxidoreductase [Acidobacteriaceae bacterium]|nr:SDR family oxidoreductase [Acidobacteriaceae bacterium]
MSDSKPLAGKRALVTGAARRIGAEIARALASAGADVAITYNRSEDEAARLVRELAGMGVAAMAAHCDLHDPQQIRKAVSAVAATFGGLDILVNNAGAFETAKLEEITPEQWDAIFATNTRGPFLMAQAAYPHLKAARGRIVNIGSLGGVHPWATHAHYCTSKAALHMLSQTMAKAWAPEISVNCVAPGMVVSGDVPAAEYAHFAAKTPMRRNGSAADVAAAVLFFATGPHFITGQLLAVDGGLGLA